jgi:hypothetical protein
MAYNHNPFMGLSNSLITAEIADVTTRLKIAENKLKDTLFLIPSSTSFAFEEILDLLPLFTLYTDGSVSMSNGTYTGNPLKLHIKININYVWYGAEYSPRYFLSVKKNDEIIFNVMHGMDDSVDTMNKLFEDILIDLNNGDHIAITLFKDDEIEIHETITLLKNSYISFGIV